MPLQKKEGGRGAFPIKRRRRGKEGAFHITRMKSACHSHKREKLGAYFIEIKKYGDSGYDPNSHFGCWDLFSLPVRVPEGKPFKRRGCNKHGPSLFKFSSVLVISNIYIMTQKKVKALAFKEARKLGLSYYWAIKWSRIKRGQLFVSWDWKQFQDDNPEFKVTFNCDFDEISGDFRNQISAVGKKGVVNFDDFYGWDIWPEE